MPIRRRRLLGLGALAATSVAVGLPSLAHADDFQPGPGAAGDRSLVGFVDTLRGGDTLSPSAAFLVAGWVVDQVAVGWSGVDSVEVYDGDPGAGGALLASGPASLSRPDVAQALRNGFWVNSGFSIMVPGGRIGRGARTLSVVAVTPHKGRWVLSLPVTAQFLSSAPSDAFPGDPVIRIFDPLPSSVVRSSPYLLRGIALDRNTSPFSGSGVDQVDIYLDGPRDAGGRFVASAELNKRYGEPSLEYGADRFATAGWDAQWEPRLVGSGDHELYVYARRAGSDVWTLARVRFTIAT